MDRALLPADATSEVAQPRIVHNEPGVPRAGAAAVPRNTVDTFPVNVSRQDLDLRYTWIFNPQLGYQPGDVVGRFDHELLPPATATQVTELKRRVLRTGEPLRAEVAIESHDETLYFDFAIEPIRGLDGAIEGVTNVVLDVTGPRRAKRALEAAKQDYGALFDHALNGISLCEMLFEDGEPVGWRYLAVNTAFKRQTGLGDVTGKMVDEVIPGLRAQDPELLRTYGRVVTTGQGERFETFVSALGQWYEVTAFATGGNCFAAVFDVITERKQAEAALQASARRLALAQQVGRLGVFDADLSSGAVVCTPELLALLGLPAQQAPLTSAQCLDCVVTEDQPRVRSTMRRWYRSTAGEGELAFRIARPDGEIRSMLLRASIVRDAQGIARRLVGAQADITDRRRLETEILNVSAAEQRRLAAELHDGIGQQLIGLSFLAAGIASAARKGVSPEITTLERLTEVAHDTMTGIRSLAHGLAPGGVGAASLLEALSRLASATEALHAISVELVLRGAVPRKLSAAKADHLYRIVHECIWNAVRHARPNRIVIRFHTRRSIISVSVQDDGAGMAVAPRSEGIGISLMRYRAEMIDGRLTIASRRDGGTRVRCTCPV